MLNAHVMGYPRAMTVRSREPGFYHYISRCVRSAWLCGEDPVSGRNFNHRRDWIERRLVDLAQTFAVGLYAWAAMNNHTHGVLHVDPRLPHSWDDEEVAARWSRLRHTLDGPADPEVATARKQILLKQPERLAEIRDRLGSLSWFMRFLNESIARTANAEDQCTGRFWEGRFRCQALLDDAAVLACMAYVDLNPIRAGLCDRLINSDFTTIQRRLRSLESGPNRGRGRLEPVTGFGESEDAPEISLADYVDLVEWTGRIARPDKFGMIVDKQPPVTTIRGSPGWWARCSLTIEAAFGCAVGRPARLKAHAEATGRRSMRGMSA